MIWRLLQHGVEVACGTREQMLDVADLAGFVHHVVFRRDGRPTVREGRGFYADHTEIPLRLTRGCAIVPAAAVRRRRAA